MPDTLAQLVRAKYPGVYDDLSDTDLESAVKAKHPGAYDDVPTTLAAPSKGQTVQGDSFGDKIRNAASAIGSGIVGAAKGAAHTAIDVGQQAIDAGLLPGHASSFLNPAFENPVLRKAREDTAYANTPERVGGAVETVAELAQPAMEAGKLGLAAARAVPGVIRDIAPSVGPVLNKVGSSALLDAASYLAPPIRVGQSAARFLGKVLDRVAPDAEAVKTAGGRLVKAGESGAKSAEQWISDALEELRQPPKTESVELPPAPELPPGYTPRTEVPPPAAPSPNAGGTLVPAQTPTTTQAIAAALEDARATPPPARMTTPPAPELPPGYTPRTSAPAPRQRPAKPYQPAPADTGAPAAAAPPRRPYFTRSPEDMADIAAAKARIAAQSAKTSGEINVADLPEAWKSRVGQDIFPTTGAEGKEIAAAFQQEIAARGLSTGQALSLVSKNKTLPTSVKSQLMRAITKMGAPAR
jgi:hypothetical protein